uniref:Sushi domain-containing protein n=1 Tax=Knipowitschia caucasica TaxID=637954 RepID=A0AAV2KN70_KNICA
MRNCCLCDKTLDFGTKPSTCGDAQIHNGFSLERQKNLFYTCSSGFKLLSQAWWGVARCEGGRWTTQDCVGRSIRAVHQGGPSGRSIRAVHQGGPSGRTIRAVHQGGPSGRSIRAVHQGGPSGWSIRAIRAVHQGGPSGRSIRAVHQGGPSGRSIRADHQGGPSGRSIRAVHQGGPSGRTIRAVHQGGPSGRSIRAVYQGRSIRAVHQGGPSGWSIRAVHQGGPSGGTIRAVHQGGPSGRSIRAVHQGGPSGRSIRGCPSGRSGRSIRAVHQGGPSGRSIRAVHQGGPSGRSIRVVHQGGPSGWSIRVVHQGVKQQRNPLLLPLLLPLLQVLLPGVHGDRDCSLQDFKAGSFFDSNFEMQGLSDSYSSGLSLRVHCKLGFRGFFKLTCQDGTWKHVGDRCSAISCGHPGDVMFADFSLVRGDDFVFGSQVQYSCHRGYQMTSLTSTRNCMQGGWDGHLPVCEALQCPVLAVDPKVSVDGDVEQAVAGSVVRFSCRDRGDQLVGAAQIECDETGTWTHAPPICKEISCPVPPLENFQVNNQKAVYREKDVLRYSCDAGFRKLDGRPILCLKMGLAAQWTPAPQCELITCALPRPLPEGTVFLPQDKFKFKVRETVRVKCSDDRWVKDTHTQDTQLHCTQTGDWDHRPTCQRESLCSLSLCSLSLCSLTLCSLTLCSLSLCSLSLCSLSLCSLSL